MSPFPWCHALLCMRHSRPLVPSLCRGSLTRVSHRWRSTYIAQLGLRRSFDATSFHEKRRVSGGAAALWDEPPRIYHFNNKRLKSLRRQGALLQRVAPHVECFSWDKARAIRTLWMRHLQEFDVQDLAAEASLARCMAALHPGRLAELQLPGCLVPLAAVAEPLQQLTGLASLVLYGFTEQLLGSMLGMIGSRLRSLQLSNERLTPAARDFTLQLTQLTALCIQAAGEWPDLGRLTCLSRLKQLALFHALFNPQGTLQLPPPVSFLAGLERFSFHTHGLQVGSVTVWEGASFRDSVACCMPPVTCMGRLHCRVGACTATPGKHVHPCCLLTTPACKVPLDLADCWLPAELMPAVAGHDPRV